MSTGCLRNAGILDNHWAASAYQSSTPAYYLSFNDAIIRPSNSYDRWYGLTVQDRYLIARTVKPSQRASLLDGLTLALLKLRWYA